MTAHLHPMLAREGHHLIARSEVETVLSGSDRAPLHHILRLNQIELARESLGVGRFVEPPGVNSRPDEDAAFVRPLPERLGKVAHARCRIKKCEDQSET